MNLPTLVPHHIPESNRAQRILEFWFGTSSKLATHPSDIDKSNIDGGTYRKAWFLKDDTFDEEIRQQFLTDVEQAAAGAFEGWQNAPQSAVALLLLLDQFPRNLYRGSARSFSTDPQALKVAEYLVETGADKSLPPAYRFFIYVPFEHSEAMAHQNRCVNLMQGLIESVPNLNEGFKNGLDYAIRHREVIERFGRFPHRNKALGRESTPAEN